jgi:hypothetical protein
LLRNTFSAGWLNGPGTWKHSLEVPAEITKTQETVLLIYKNPYTWTESVVFREPADMLVCFHDYGLQDSSEPEALAGRDSINLRRLAALYALHAERWLLLADRANVQVLRYEDVITYQGRERLQERLPVHRGRVQWQVPEAGSLFMSEGFQDSMIEYYLEGIPVRLTQQQLDLVNAIIPDTVFEKLCYTRIQKTR